MNEKYLETIVQYLIKIVNDNNVSGKGISEKLDEVVTAVSNIKISAESVNLNTDELEAKLDTLNQSVIANGDNSDIINELTALGTKIDTIKTAVDVLKTNIESVDTHIQSNTQTVNTAAEDINSNLISINSGIEVLTLAMRDSINTVNDKQDTANNYWASVTQRMPVNGYINPTHMMSVPEGDTTFDQNVVLCNITDNNITVTVTAADDTTVQSIVLTPGWNPVIVKAITGATANTLIYGW